MNQLNFDFIVDSQPIPFEGESKTDYTLHVLTMLKKYQLDIKKALSYSGDAYSFDDIAEGVLQGRYHFYPLPNSFVIMELSEFPNYKVYHTFLAGGDMNEIIGTHPWMKENAKVLGCKYVSVTGRHGWTRKLKAEGWKHMYDTLYLELET